MTLPNELASRAGTSGSVSGRRLRWLALLPLSVFAILIQGYHPGLEDDAFYLAAIKQNLNPSLFLTTPTFSECSFRLLYSTS